MIINVVSVVLALLTAAALAVFGRGFGRWLGTAGFLLVALQSVWYIVAHAGVNAIVVLMVGRVLGLFGLLLGFVGALLSSRAAARPPKQTGRPMSPRPAVPGSGYPTSGAPAGIRPAPRPDPQSMPPGGAPSGGWTQQPPTGATSAGSWGPQQ